MNCWAIVAFALACVAWRYVPGVNEAAIIVSAGVGAGLLGSLLLTRFLQTLLFDTKPTNPLTFGALTVLLSAVALLASFIPARRASRIDPLLALRHE